MPLQVFFLICFVILASPLKSHARGSRRPANDACPHVRVDGKIDPPLSVAELRWICGDSESDAYKNVPPYQAAYHLRAFLDSRGYTAAELKILDGVLIVKPGKPVEISSIELEPRDLALEKIALQFRGQILRPSTLNAIESTLQRRLLESGYSCATVRSTAREDRVSLQILRGPKRDFSNFKTEAIAELRPEALLRFQPFERDSPYDIRLLELYEKRLLRDNIVQGTYFKENCKLQSSPIEQSFLLGPPRTLRFGVGVDTESGPLLQMSWRNHRFSRMAAQANVTTQASLIQQSLLGRVELFPWPTRPRASMTPELRLERTDIDDRVDITSALQSLAGLSWDTSTARWSFSSGPALITQWFQTASLPGYRRESSVALLGRAEFRTHRYEIYDLHPQDGTLLSLSGEYRDPLLGFPDRTLKLSSEARFLSPLGRCGKGRCVGAIRVLGANTWTSAGSLDLLPRSLKSYLGGFESLRGFKLSRVPDNDGVGALSSVASGLELRGVDFYGAKWEPYIFFDIGAVGSESMRLDATLYTSLGLGLRWASPIGMIQAYVSRPNPGDFYAYAAFGGEF